MRALVSLALPTVALTATAAAASPQNYPSAVSFTYRAGGNPFGITFLEDTGQEWALGWVGEDGGRIRYTTNGGEDWTQAVVPESVRGQLRGIQFVSETDGFCVGDNGVVLQSTDGGETWTKIADLEGLQGFEPLHQVDFDSEGEDGWVMGDTRALYHTTDGGETWDYVEHPAQHGADIYDIAFPDPEDRDTFVLALDYGTLLRTEDGGANWDSFSFSPCDNSTICPQPGLFPTECLELWSVDFYDDQHGIAVGGVVTNNGYILRTDDGGETWSQESCMQFVDCSSNCEPVPTFYGALATGTESAITVGYAASVMIRTTGMENNGVCGENCLSGTGGYGWLQKNDPDEHVNPPNNWIAPAGTNTAFATALNGRIRKISYDGETITDVGTAAWIRVEGGKFTSLNNGFLVGQDQVIIKATNGGKDLELVKGKTEVSPGTPNFLNAVDVYGSDVVAVGDGGVIWHSPNGGATGTWTDVGISTATLNNVRFTPDGSAVIAVGNNGTILVSTNGGEDWTSFGSSPSSADLHDVHFTDGTVWVVGSNKLVAKKTSGSAWVLVQVNGSASPTLRAATGAGSHLYVVGDGGSVYRYDTSEEEFNLQNLGPAATTEQLTDVVRIPGTDDILVTGDNGVVLYRDAEKILLQGQGAEYKWSQPKSYMGSKLVSIDMFSTSSGMITGLRTGVLEVQAQ